MLWCSLFGLRS